MASDQHTWRGSPMGTLVTYTLNGTRWLTLPTGNNRAITYNMCTDDRERRVASMRSHDIEIRMKPGEGPFELAARILRCEAYFHAVLVQSRGTHVEPCGRSCSPDETNRRFRECVRVDGFENGACAECIWQSTERDCDDDEETDFSSDSSSWDSGVDDVWRETPVVTLGAVERDHDEDIESVSDATGSPSDGSGLESGEEDVSSGEGRRETPAARTAVGVSAAQCSQ